MGSSSASVPPAALGGLDTQCCEAKSATRSMVEVSVAEAFQPDRQPGHSAGDTPQVVNASSASFVVKTDKLTSRAAYGFVFVSTILVTAVGTIMEICRYNASFQFKDDTSIRSVEQLHRAVFGVWPTWLCLLYSLKESLVHISMCATLVTTLAFGLGCRTVKWRRLGLLAFCLGSVNGMFTYVCRTASGPIAICFRVASYMNLNLIFLLVPLMHREQVKQLRRGAMFWIIVTMLFFAFTAAIAKREYNESTPFYVLAALFLLEGFLCMGQAYCDKKSRPFHDLGYLFGICFFIMAYPFFTSVMWTFLQDENLQPARKMLMTTGFSFFAKVFMYVLSMGAVSWQETTATAFIVMYQEHFQAKCILARTYPLSWQFFSSSILSAISELLQGTQHGRHFIKLVLTPIILYCPCARKRLRNRLLLDRPMWKAIMLVERSILRAEHNSFANSIATAAVLTLIATQSVIRWTGVMPAISVNDSGPRWEQFVAWTYLLMLNEAVRQLIRWSAKVYVRQHLEVFMRAYENNPESTEVNPAAFLREADSCDHKGIELRRFDSFRRLTVGVALGAARKMSQWASPGRSQQRELPTLLEEGEAARSSQPADDAEAVGDADGSIRAPAGNPAKKKLRSGLLDCYMRQAEARNTFKHFGPFEELTLEKPSLLLHHDIEDVFRAFMVRFSGFFAFIGIYITLQFLYDFNRVHELLRS